MKSICFFFQIHHPSTFQRYRFFDIGNNAYYYDDFYNEVFIQKVAKELYLPVNEMIKGLSESLEGKFKIALTVSGTALRLFEIYAPEMIKSLQELEQTGCLELVSQPCSNSLSSLQDYYSFEEEITKHTQAIEKFFCQKPQILSNAQLIYSDDIGEKAYSWGFKGILAADLKEFSHHKKNNNALYVNAKQQRLKVIANNGEFKSLLYSDLVQDSAFGQSTKYIKGLIDGEAIAIFDNYYNFCSNLIRNEQGLENFQLFAQKMLEDNIQFLTPTEVIEKVQPAASVSVKNPVLGFSQTKSTNDLLNNEMQNEAINKLYGLQPQIKQCNDSNLLADWMYLQSIEHFLLMTKDDNKPTDYDVENKKLFESPYEAFINYMNILSDFKIRLQKAIPQEMEEDIDSLKQLLQEKEQKIAQLQQKIEALSQK